jgi:3-dehydroquinate dehydratase-2
MADRLRDERRLLWVLHGVNLDMLGLRNAAHYGELTLAELEAAVTAEAEGLGFAVRCRQTNHEGRLIETLHDIAREGTDALLINPGAWTHYSYALRDALELVAAPVAEVHLSDIEGREEWRRRSVIADLAAVRVSGKGVDGYREALRALAGLVLGPSEPEGTRGAETT